MCLKDKYELNDDDNNDDDNDDDNNNHAVQPETNADDRISDKYNVTTDNSLENKSHESTFLRNVHTKNNIHQFLFRNIRKSRSIHTSLTKLLFSSVIKYFRP